MNQNTKLLFVTHLFYPAIGGVELHIKNLSAGLVKRGYDVQVLTTNAYSTEAFFLGDKRRITEPESIVDGVAVKRLPFRTFGAWVLKKMTSIACRLKYPLNEWIRLLHFGPRNWSFIPQILAIDADVILASPLPHLNIYYAYRAAQRSQKPLVIIPSYHICDPCSFYNTLYFKMMRAADCIVALSPLERDFLAREAHIPKERFFVLPPLPLQESQLTLLPRDKNQLRQHYGITEKNVILYLGQHGVHKRVNQVLDAMPYVWQVVPDTALVIAGGVTDNTKVLKNHAAELTANGSGKVYFIDNFPAQEKEDIFRMADIFISLSEMESFGIVLVEALNCGLPVVASKNNVSRYIVEEAQTGILVEPQCLTEVAGALIELLTDEGLRQAFATNAVTKARTLYHPQIILDHWEKVIDHVIRNRHH